MSARENMPVEPTGSGVITAPRAFFMRWATWQAEDLLASPFHPPHWEVLTDLFGCKVLRAKFTIPHFLTAHEVALLVYFMREAVGELAPVRLPDWMGSFSLRYVGVELGEGYGVLSIVYAEKEE